MSGRAPGGTPRLVTTFQAMCLFHLLWFWPLADIWRINNCVRELKLWQKLFSRDLLRKKKLCCVLKMSKIWSLFILFHTFSYHALSCRPKKNVFIMESRHRKTLFHLFSGPYFTPCRGFFRWKCDTSRKHSEISIMRSSASQSAGWWNPITRWILIITFSQTPLITPEVLISQDFFLPSPNSANCARVCVRERI